MKLKWTLTTTLVVKEYSSDANTNPSEFSENFDQVLSTFISVGEEILPIVYALFIIPFLMLIPMIAMFIRALGSLMVHQANYARIKLFIPL